MKKTIKFCAVAGAVLLLVGLGITFISGMMGGRFRNSFPYHHLTNIWRHNRLWDNHWERRADYDGSNTNVFSNAGRLDVDIDKGSVRIYENQDIEEITVSIEDSYNRTKSYMDGDTLKIKRSNTHRSADNPYVEIAVPTGYTFDKVSLDVGAAQCEINNISASKLDIDAGVGDITFTGSVTGDVELDTGVGTVTLNLSGSEQDYNYKVDCGVGTVKIGGSEYNMMSPEKRIDNQAPYNMDLDCGVGEVTINFNQTV